MSKRGGYSESKQNYSESSILYGWGLNTNVLREYQRMIVYAASGENHSIFITNKNEVFGFGSNRFGQLGISEISNFSSPIEILTELTKVTMVFCGAEHTFVITSKNQVYSFGLNIKGQLGHCMFENINKAKLVVSLLPHGRKNAKSSNKELMKRPKPTIYSILEKFQIQVKYEEEDSQENLLLLADDEYIEDISCGALHTLALSNKGRLFGAGFQNIGKGNEDYASRAEFQQIKINDKKIKAIHAGLSGSIAIVDGSAYAWGKFGKVSFNIPTFVKFSQIPFKQEQFIIDGKVGDGFILLLNSKGEVFSMGENIQNQLGYSQIFADNPKRINKLPLVRSIFAGRNYCLAIGAQDNTVYGWGSNQHGQVMLGSKKNMIIANPISIGIFLREGEKLIPSSYLTLALKKDKIEEKKDDDKQEMRVEKEETISLKEYQKLQYQYQLLKNMNMSLIQKSHRPVLSEIGTQTSSKFEVTGISKHRTFDTNLEIEWDELIMDKVISEGGYGIIYKAKWRETIVAVKKFKIENGDVGVRDFLSECHAMEAVRHPNIVMFLGACTKPPNYAIVLEYCVKGSLWSLLQNPDIQLPWEQRRRIAMEIAKAVLYLHLCNPPILHRDLKSLNILLDDNLRVKIADFGWTKTLSNYMTSKIGTYQWMAPEVIGSQNYSEKADVFSYSIILWEIASREPPYKNINGQQVAQKVLNQDFRPTLPKKTPEAFSKLIKRCWQKLEDKRPNFKQIIKQLQIMKL